MRLTRHWPSAQQRKSHCVRGPHTLTVIQTAHCPSQPHCQLWRGGFGRQGTQTFSMLGKRVVKQKLQNRCWWVDKNLLHVFVFTCIVMGKVEAEKIPQLPTQGSGRSPSPASPKKLNVSMFPAGTTSESTARCSQQQNNSCTIGAATEWLNSSFYRHGVIKTWCSFVLHKAPTLLTPSSNLTGY